ncbi:unnamed protein product, partial [Coregonus sp. 'balchen']
MAVKTTICFLRRSCPCNLLGTLPMQPLSANGSRRCSSSQPTKQGNSTRKRSQFIPAADSKHDWIGPPHRLSNLRPILYHIHEKDTFILSQLKENVLTERDEE